MSGAVCKVTQIVRRGIEDDYWDESRREWRRGHGTRYRSIEAARAAVERFKLDGSVVTHR